MLIHGDARYLPLADASVDCCITSPPYFGLRDYGHKDQIGLELDPKDYVEILAAVVFEEVKRVLKPLGTLWLNIGDSYAAGWKRQPEGCKEKDLLGIPWTLAFALRNRGWYLRSDIIWSKPNPMPESVTDRPTKAHEYLFLLTKGCSYYYDADAIREPWTCDRDDMRKKGVRTGVAYLQKRDVPLNHPEYTKPYNGKAVKEYKSTCAQNPSEVKARIVDSILDGTLTGRNKRSVWTIPTMPYAGAHFATMPEKLVEPCIFAGCPLGGLVLDPFVGSGTVVAVAERLGRRGVGVDLSYQDLAKQRTAQRGIPFTELW